MYVEITDDDESINYFNMADVEVLRTSKWERGVDENGDVRPTDYVVLATLCFGFDMSVYMVSRTKEKQREVYEMLKKYKEHKI